MVEAMDWTIRKLGEIAEIRSGGSAPQGDKWFGGDHPFVRVQHVDGLSDWVTRSDWITDDAVKAHRLKLFPKGTIVLPKSGASIRLEKRGILTGDSYLASHLAAINPLEDMVDSDFLFFTLRSLRLAKEKSDGYPTLNLSELSEVEIPFPPLQEQRAIASVLRAVQQAKEATQKVIDASHQLKHSMMRHLFAYGAVDPSKMDYLKLVEAQCGLQPKHWKCIRMGDIVSDGPQNGLYKHLSHYGQGTPIVRIDDYPNEGGVIKSANHRLTLSDSDRITYSLRTGDLLVNRVNSLSHIGKTALVGELEESIVFESNMMRFAVRRELVSPFFVYLFLNTSEARKELRGRAKRAVAQSSINQGDLMSLMVPIPPLDEQNQIVEQINALVNKVKTEEKHVIALTTLLQSLLNGLLTEKMRVREFVNNESQS